MIKKLKEDYPLLDRVKKLPGWMLTDILKGTSLHIEKENKKTYRCLWTSAYGSYTMNISKDKFYK